MIGVNLLRRTRRSAAARAGSSRERHAVAIGLTWLVLTTVGTGAAWWHLLQDLTRVDARIAFAGAELDRLRDSVKLVEQASARKAALTEQLGAVERLRAARLDPVRLLEAVGQSVPEGVWLSEIKQHGTRVEIDGRAVSLAAVTDFAERMQTAGVFTMPVEIVSTTTETLDRTTVVRFSVRVESTSP